LKHQRLGLELAAAGQLVRGQHRGRQAEVDELEHVDRVRQVAQPVQAEIAQARACGVPAESGAARVTQIAFTGPWGSTRRSP
jgi:hypothetical protein